MFVYRLLTLTIRQRECRIEMCTGSSSPWAAATASRPVIAISVRFRTPLRGISACSAGRGPEGRRIGVALAARGLRLLKSLVIPAFTRGPRGHTRELELLIPPAGIACCVSTMFVTHTHTHARVCPGVCVCAFCTYRINRTRHKTPPPLLRQQHLFVMISLFDGLTCDKLAT